MSKIIGIIPARFTSSRFPGKPLADIAGKSMIQRVYERASSVLDRVIVATDDRRILDHVSTFGEAAMTSSSHQSGTDRCAELVSKLTDLSYVINIQGDEPFIDPKEIKKLIQYLEINAPEVEIATMATPMSGSSDIDDPNKVKVVCDVHGKALYFSRSRIPYNRTEDSFSYLQHIGIYAYRHDILKELASLPPSPLELSESLEQLRWLENGFRIDVLSTTMSSWGIDTPQDLEKALEDKLWQTN